MTREEAKEMLPVLQAFANGKTIQIRKHGEESYYDSTNSKLNFDLGYYSYRVKPEPKCRPFRNVDECWQEMQKHQPFGIMSSKNRKDYMSFKSLIDEGCDFCGYEGENFESAFDDIQFADGTPFGIKED